MGIYLSRPTLWSYVATRKELEVTFGELLQLVMLNKIRIPPPEKPLQDVVTLHKLMEENNRLFNLNGLKLTIGRTLLQQCNNLLGENNASKLTSVRVGVIGVGGVGSWSANALVKISVKKSL